MEWFGEKFSQLCFSVRFLYSCRYGWEPVACKLVAMGSTDLCLHCGFGMFDGDIACL